MPCDVSGRTVRSRFSQRGQSHLAASFVTLEAGCSAFARGKGQQRSNAVHVGTQDAVIVPSTQWIMLKIAPLVEAGAG